MKKRPQILGDFPAVSARKVDNIHLYSGGDKNIVIIFETSGPRQTIQQGRFGTNQYSTGVYIFTSIFCKNSK